MDRKRKRLIFDASNLSILPDTTIRTGIQQVIFQVVKAITAVRHEFPAFEIILAPRLPERCGRNIEFSIPRQSQNNTPLVLEALENELRVGSSELWGFDLKSADYRFTDLEAWALLFSADAIHIQSLVDLAPIFDNASRFKPTLKNRISVTVYDIIPAIFPEYFSESMAKWFSETYLSGLAKHADHAIGISRHTALDLKNHPVTGQIKKISFLPLPIEVPADTGLARQSASPRHTAYLGKPYLVFLGSVEPRKNLLGLVEGFELFRDLHQKSILKLVIISGTGWKNDHTLARIHSSRYQSDIHFAGYLSDSEMIDVVSNSQGLGMLSLYEGYGLPVAYAHALGVPVLTGVGSSLPEACRGQGYFVDPLDPYSVCSGISLLVKSEKRRIAPAASVVEPTWADYCRALINTISTTEGKDSKN